MKSIISKILSLAIPAMLIGMWIITMTGCREAPINGALDGQWQIMKIEYFDGYMDIPEKKYYCFNQHVAQLTSGTELKETVYANMTYTGETLTLHVPASQGGNNWRLLEVWGLVYNPTTFKIITLNRSTLIMESESLRLTLRRF